MKRKLKSRNPAAASPKRAPQQSYASPLQEMPGHLIRRAHQTSTALFADECGRFDLTAVQFAALFVLRAAGELGATRIAELIAFDRATIGDVIDRLESKGWVARDGSSNDRRVKLIRLTRDGTRLLKLVEPSVHRVQQRLMECFSDSENAALMKFLKRLDGLEFAANRTPSATRAARRG
jgi:DNA-binding MarR family transcriptional regulator